MKIMFMGTPDFASYCLENLILDKFEVSCVVTKIDTKKDRGHQVKFSSVKESAIKNNVKVYQPQNLKEENFLEILKNENPDIIVVVAYGKILPCYVLKYPKYGCINVHASLLPKYRGAAPIQYSVYKGENESGVTTMLMNAGLDTGDILIQKSVAFDEGETGGSLHDKLMVVGYETLRETLNNIDNLKPIKQDETLVTYAPPIKKEDTVIDFNCDVLEIINKIRGFYPFPGTSFKINNTSYKIHKVLLYSKEDVGQYGKIVEFSKDKLLISAKNGILNILELQPQGKRKMSVCDFYNGNKNIFL